MTRTWLALLFTSVAISVPCGFWYVIGSREVKRQADEIRAEPLQLAQDTAEMLAERIETSITTLIDNETRRPFYHYQDLYHDPLGAYEGRAVIPSPLAQGSLDPLVEAYFRIDTNGRLSMPSLSDLVPELNRREPLADRQRMFHELDRTKIFFVNAFQAKPAPANPASAPPAAAPLMAADPTKFAPGPGKSVEVLDSSAWQQNTEAAEIYRKLKNKKPGAVHSPPASKTKEVVITIEPFHIVPVPVAGKQRLAAIRRVLTPSGPTIQGLLISAIALRAELQATPMPASLQPGPPEEMGQAAVRLDGTLWHITVDDERAREEAERYAREMEQDFLKVFGLVLAAVSLAGFSVVGLVWQTERLARQREQFAAAAAHELKTPLASLRIYSGMLVERLGDPAQYREYARQISQEVERLSRVVTNVLDFTRRERGAPLAAAARGNLREAVEEGVAMVRPVLETAGMKLETEFAEQVPAAVFDPDAVVHILQNLLDNAEKYTRSVPHRAARVVLKPGRRGVDLIVSDNGPGVPPEERLRLFQAFCRGSSPNLPAGIGLGLAMVKTLAEAQGAQVVYETAPPGPPGTGGAGFRITFKTAPSE